MNKISVCIPTYEMNGKGVKYLNQLLQTIDKQNYSNFEVIISDHSLNEDIKNLASKFNKIDLKYFKNHKSKGSSSANINNAIEHASGDIIKVMFQDDLFVNPKALEIVSNLLTEKHWGVCGCVHTKDDENTFFYKKIPEWQDDIKKGVNTIGGPSTLFFRKTDIKFDERLLQYMDTDFYYSMYLKYGLPFIEPRPLICSRFSSTSVTSTMVTDELVIREDLIVKEKYGF